MNNKLVKQEVCKLDERVRSAVAIQTMTLKVQVISLRQAEKLRKMVLSFGMAWKKGRREHASAERLIKFAKSLSAFHKDPRGYVVTVRKVGKVRR